MITVPVFQIDIVVSKRLPVPMAAAGLKTGSGSNKKNSSGPQQPASADDFGRSAKN